MTPAEFKCSVTTGTEKLETVNYGFHHICTAIRLVGHANNCSRD